MASEQIITFRQHLRPEQVGEYLLLPFEVPPDTVRLEVSYCYDRAIPPVPGAPPGNALDLGLFDAHGAEWGCWAGFRGYSGTARQSAFITVADATPGYLPGPLLPGTWHVLLGLYMLHPTGCDCEVTIRLWQGASPVSQPLSWPAPQVLREARWYRGDLHCHSHHSEARGTLDELCAAARAQGLDFLAITEHNTTSHHALLPQFRTADFIPIPGQEVTTYRGHANVWGAAHWVDFRTHDEEGITQAIAIAHAAGGLFSVNHPKTKGPPWLYDTFAGIDCLEVWQGPWFLSNYQSLALWDCLLAAGQRVVGVGGSDEHQHAAEEGYEWSRIGQPTTWVYAPALEPNAILEAIRAGHVAISASPEGPHLTYHALAGEEQVMMGDALVVPVGSPVRLTGRVRGAEGLLLRLISNGGVLEEIPISSDDLHFHHTLEPVVANYVRVEVAEPMAPADADEPAARMIQALGNPIYIQVI